MCTIPTVLFAMLSVFLFVKSEIHKNQYSFYEISYLSIIVFLSISVCLWPFVIWWWYVISETFKKGVELNAKSKKMNLKFVLGLGIKYTFSYKGKEIEHIASLVANKKTRNIANETSISIIYNPKKKISFIKEAYI